MTTKQQNNDISFLDMFNSLKCDSIRPLFVFAGQDGEGKSTFLDLTKSPIIIAGATGSGKSQFLHSIIVSILLNKKVDKVQLTLIDPTRIEFGIYSDVSNDSVLVIQEGNKSIAALEKAAQEVQSRLKLLKDSKQKDIEAYNFFAELNKLPILEYSLVVVDEMADLYIANKESFLQSLTQLLEYGSKTGILLVIATQTPYFILELMKKYPITKIAGFMSSKADSQAFLGNDGATKLLNKGDFIISIDNKETRIHLPNLEFAMLKKVAATVKKTSQKTKKVPGDEDAS